MVHITAGCIGWMPDIMRFFEICKSTLRPGGICLIHEIHPFAEMLPWDGSEIGDKIHISKPYFRNGPSVQNGSLDYLGGTQYKAKPQYWFTHTISDVVLALSHNGFKITQFIESPRDISAGHSKIEKMQKAIPLSMIIVAEA